VEALGAELALLGTPAADLDVTAICIGPTTAQAASDAGWRRVETADNPEPQAIHDAVLRLVTT
jgi:uroporphyrinogen-III synthase